MKTQLISTDSLLYKRRLVKELNAQPDGFYSPAASHNIRCMRARIERGSIQVMAFQSGMPEWFYPYSQTVFTDAYGRYIVASRQPKKGSR